MTCRFSFIKEVKNGMKIEERLTTRLENGAAVWNQCGGHYLDCAPDMSVVLNRLCRYEDTELSPEEIERMKGKQIPKKICVDLYGWNECPNHCTTCGLIQRDSKYCPHCGQALKWD